MERNPKPLSSKSSSILCQKSVIAARTNRALLYMRLQFRFSLMKNVKWNFTKGLDNQHLLYLMCLSKLMYMKRFSVDFSILIRMLTQIVCYPKILYLGSNERKWASADVPCEIKSRVREPLKTQFEIDHMFIVQDPLTKHQSFLFL